MTKPDTMASLAFLLPDENETRSFPQRVLSQLFQDTAAAVGEDFFRAAVRSLAAALGVRWVFLGEVLDDARLRVRYFSSDNRLLPEFEHDIAGSPCQGVVARELCCYPAGVQRFFPQDTMLRRLGVEGYLGVPLLDSHGRPLGILALLHDAPLKEPSVASAICGLVAGRAGAELERLRAEQELRESERRFREMAFTDSLTGLPNRMLLLNRLEHALDRAHRFGDRLALLFLDLDDFKQVNDCFGHDIGDAVLVDAAGRMAGCVRAADTAARIGGDEFVVLLEQCGDGREAQVAAEHIRAAFSSPFVVGGQSLSLSVSIGISTYQADRRGLRASDLLQQADQAMSRVKLKRQRNSWFPYRPLTRNTLSRWPFSS